MNLSNWRLPVALPYAPTWCPQTVNHKNLYLDFYVLRMLAIANCNCSRTYQFNICTLRTFYTCVCQCIYLLGLTHSVGVSNKNDNIFKRFDFLR
ncbi:hypothetical protein EUGRSUZ_I02050 [Eucalyptus grandis]|uniref:Uncharacterized protein n=2 Tax=Eucalyptus grandis TaxID=71139 RepID=A0ACC3JH81_EUCGR|nr:hypothetical protein EUGRSUZ_I02050 [Eucalyptus grandis]